MKIREIRGFIYFNAFNLENSKEIVERNYRIIYKNVTKKMIYILMIYHGTRNLKRRIK